MANQRVNGFVRLNRGVSSWVDRTFPSFAAEADYKSQLRGLIGAFLGPRPRTRVLEAGGIDRPLLARGPEVVYDGLDIEHREACETIYDDFLVQSIEEPIPREYDLIISVTLLEHVRDNHASLRSCFGALTPGGAVMHYLPSRYHPYSLILRAIGPRLQKKLIDRLHPEARAVAGYPAFFHLCSPRQMRRALQEIGYANIRVLPSYRAAGYFTFLAPVYVLVLAYENLCRALGLQELCSGFVVVAEKPMGARS